VDYDIELRTLEWYGIELEGLEDIRDLGDVGQV
jgi:hypothetical protein